MNDDAQDVDVWPAIAAMEIEHGDDWKQLKPAVRSQHRMRMFAIIEARAARREAKAVRAEARVARLERKVERETAAAQVKMVHEQAAIQAAAEREAAAAAVMYDMYKTMPTETKDDEQFRKEGLQFLASSMMAKHFPNDVATLCATKGNICRLAKQFKLTFPGNEPESVLRVCRMMAKIQKKTESKTTA